MKLFKKEYIEKCANSVDLKMIWVPESGHYFKTKDTELKILHEHSVLVFFRSSFWVPRQDELQTILKEKIDKYKNMTELKFDYHMRYYISKLYCTKILNVLTLNDMWLIFFMNELFNKYWAFERKEWMKNV